MATTTQSLLLPVGGDLPVNPTIFVKPTVARAAPAANVGWTFRRRCTITNTGSEPVSNYPFAIDLGDTTPLTTTKAQADADDVRVICNGREVARTLVDWDTTSTLCWIVIPYLGAGEVGYWDVWYGNTAAVSGGVPALTLMDDLPAFDIQTTGVGTRSTNAKWFYRPQRVAANAGKGGWGLSSGTVQPNLSFTVPGAWEPERTKQSDDDSWQQGSSTYVDTNTYYQGRFEARRARPGGLVVSRDSGVDGVRIRVPVGITSVRADIRWTNLEMGDTGSNPVGKVVIVTRNRPDEEWTVLYSNAATQATEATIATATYPSSGSANAKELAFAVWPFDGDNVNPAAQPDRYINAAWYTTLELNVVDTVITQSLAAEETIYELATELRYQGGGDSAGVPPYKSIFLGNAKSASGEGTPRLAVDSGNSESVKILTAERRMEIWNTGLTAKVEDVAIPAVSAVDGVYDPVAAATAERVSVEWMPLLPTANPLTNPSATTDATGWTRGTVTAGITVGSLTRDTGTFDSTPASFTATISGNTSGTNGIVEEIASDYLPVGEREAIQVGVAVRTENANIQPTPSIWWYDSAQVAHAVTPKSMQADWTVTASAFRRRLFAARVPDGAVYYRVGVTARCKTSNPTGQYRFDTVEVNDTEIALLDVSTGTIDLRVDGFDRYGSGA